MVKEEEEGSEDGKTRAGLKSKRWRKMIRKQKASGLYVQLL